MGGVRAVVATPALWLVCLAPLAVVPGGFAPYQLPTLALVALAVLLAALDRRSAGTLPPALVLCGAVGLVVLVVAALASVAPVAALLGRWPRYEGLPVWLAYAGAAWAGARLLGPGAPPARRARELPTAVATSAVLLGLTSVAGEWGLSPVGDRDATRAGGLLGNATDQGVVAMVFALLLVGPAVRTRRPWWWAGVAGSLLTLGLSGSRAALGATLLVVVVVIAAVLGRGRRAVTGAGVAAAAVVAVALALPQARDRLGDAGTLSGRWQLWEESLRLVGDHPVLGVGPSGFVDAVGRLHGADWVREVGVHDPVDSPHAWPLQALVAGGPVLLLLAVAALVLVVRRGWRAVRRAGADDPFPAAALAAVAAYAVVLLTHFPSPTTACLVAAVAGGLVARPTAEPTWLRPTVSVLAGVCLVGWAMASAGEVVLQHGADAARRGEVEGAVADYRLARTLRPWDVDVDLLASQALAGAASAQAPGAAEAAETAARRGLGRTPDSDVEAVALGLALNLQDRPAEALPVLERAVHLAPTSPSAHLQRALARLGTGDLEGARRDLESARRLDPSDPTAGRLLERTGLSGE